MRERPDGYLEAETFEEHMMPGIRWIENDEFNAAFAAQTGAGMDFSAALAQVKQGVAVRRPGWSEGAHLVSIEGRLTKIDPETEYTGEWRPSHDDMMEDDWEFAQVGMVGEYDPDVEADEGEAGDGKPRRVIEAEIHDGVTFVEE